MTIAILNEIATFNKKIQKAIYEENKRNLEQGKPENNQKDKVPLPNIFDHTYDLQVLEFIR